MVCNRVVDTWWKEGRDKGIWIVGLQVVCRLGILIANNGQVRCGIKGTVNRSI